MTAGRPPKPLELKMLEGDNGRDLSGHKLPEPVNPMLARKQLVPDIPDDVNLLSWGTRKWTEVWSAAWWLHDEDIHFVVFICKNFDRIQLFQQAIDAEGFTVPGYMGKGMVEHPLIPLQLKVERAIVSDLSQLGFGPVARNKLAIGAIKTANALQDFQSKVKDNSAPEPEDEGWDFESDADEKDDIVDGEVTESEAA